MIKKTIVSVVGTRPEFIKLAAIAPHLAKHFNHQIINTGQHYDNLMANNFFKELKIAKPNWNLSIGSSSSALQTANIIKKCAVALSKINPSFTLVYGDTNSTLGGAVAAVKSNMLVGHIEAGMRSYDKTMPEEVNRIICDHISSILFCSSKYSVECLKKEGVNNNVFLTGDINYDIFKKTKIETEIPTTLQIKPKGFYLLTIHRQENTLSLKRLEKLLTILTKLKKTVIFPMHPKTGRLLVNVKIGHNIKLLKPLPFSQTLTLIKMAKAVLTDSGGIQKEAYWLKTPCITLRSTTEWQETVNSKWNHLVKCNEKLILKHSMNPHIPKKHQHLYGDGHASEKIVKILLKFLV
ncbi:MAG: UDP-n-acetylglucosamine 2-epimerase [Candidatus Curtissbacteria bacterium GW2011_GWA1_40_9]|uniref:UDP-n-acetylglucosamine 2-epimerase n=1 Tax=Candidatus Curtissbacteria bacterium GW2011_GWA1_40_9 TaxID=1618408 RepID=A0A0G0TMR8_9BACT|nr:MAG: UDP-n-acetylglucosamine 2-epimerase [Candidatus Curtissbacteria bacterium GW2011_GWA1_40_9]